MQDDRRKSGPRFYDIERLRRLFPGACSSKQLYIINRETKRIDPGSFIVMLQANEVEGEGFKRLELGEQS